jgi:hypothetical protein
VAIERVTKWNCCGISIKVVLEIVDLMGVVATIRTKNVKPKKSSFYLLWPFDKLRANGV